VATILRPPKILTFPPGTFCIYRANVSVARCRYYDTMIWILRPPRILTFPSGTFCIFRANVSVSSCRFRRNFVVSPVTNLQCLLWWPRPMTMCTMLKYVIWIFTKCHTWRRICQNRKTRDVRKRRPRRRIESCSHVVRIVVSEQKIRFTLKPTSTAKCGPQTSTSVPTKPTEACDLADVFPLDIRMILLVRKEFVPHGRVNYLLRRTEVPA
jgi:hypothetical protein